MVYVFEYYILDLLSTNYKMWFVNESEPIYEVLFYYRNINFGRKLIPKHKMLLLIDKKILHLS